MDEQVIETATGLGYVELMEGTGARPKTGDTVSVHYTGWLAESRSRFPSARAGSSRDGTRAWAP